MNPTAYARAWLAAAALLAAIALLASAWLDLRDWTRRRRRRADDGHGPAAPDNDHFHFLT